MATNMCEYCSIHRTAEHSRMIYGFGRYTIIIIIIILVRKAISKFNES